MLIPTRYGKSLIFINQNCLVTVIASLNATKIQYVQKLGDTARKSDLKNIKNGTTKYLLCHPEDIVANGKLSDLFQSDNLRNVKKCILLMKNIVFWIGALTSDQAI